MEQRVNLSEDSQAKTLTPASNEHSATTKKRKRKSSKPEFENTTILRRMENLLKILEVHKVREINYLLVEEFSRLDCGGLDQRYVVDRRTLTRLAERLEKEKKVHLIKCSIPMLNGSMLSRTLLLHGSVSTSDEVVQKYIEGLREQSAISSRAQAGIIPSAGKLAINQPDTGSVSRMELSYDSPTTSKGDEPAQSVSNDVYYPSTVRAIAKYYGYITAYMLRMKLFHRHMLKLGMQTTHGAGDQSTYSVSTAKVITNMSLKTFLMVVGVRQRIPLLDTYLTSDENSKTIIDDLPPHIRTELFQGNLKYRRALRQSIDLLCALELVKPIKDREGVGLPKHCELLQNVPLRNYREQGHPIIRTAPMKTLDDHQKYWEELQFISTEKTLGQRDSVDGNAKSNDKTKSENTLAGMTAMASWYMRFNLDRRSRNILEKHIDRVNRTTPYNNHRLCFELANECGISIQIVREYFKSIQYPKKRRTAAQRKAAKERSTDARSVAVDALLSNATLDYKKALKPHILSTEHQRNKRRGITRRRTKPPNMVFDGEGKAIIAKAADAHF